MSINNEQEKQSKIIKPYFSCEWIEGGLAFAHDSLHICCEPQGWFHISDFHGGEIPVSAIRSAREQLKDDIQKNDRHNCHRCPKLHYQTWEQKRYLVDIINFSHFYLCNLKCNYCYLQIKNIDARNDKPYNIYPILKSMIEQGQISPGVKVFWGGGEPTILKDFDKIIELLSEIQAFQTFNTNSVVFSSAVYNYLEKSDRFFLTTSIDAGTPETFIKIKGADLFHRTVDN
ncbi:radical SAM protein, partial [bacterium]